jgi:hypothetical protein
MRDYDCGTNHDCRAFDDCSPVNYVSTDHDRRCSVSRGQHGEERRQ